MADLYAVLGVARDAGRATLRRAYRRALKRAHPDGGGSVEKFRLVALALEVLIDPVRRARYDATGEYEAGVVDNRAAELMNLVAAAIDQAVAECARQGVDPERVDLLDRVRAVFAERSRAHAAQKASLSGEVARWERLAGRFERVGEGENALAALARGKVEAIRGLMARCDAETERGSAALEWLKDYRFRSDGPRAAVWAGGTLPTMRRPAGMWG